MGEVARQSSGGKGETLLGLFGRKRRSKKDAQSADGFAPFVLGDADKMPLAKFLMIAEENFRGYPSRKVPPVVDRVHPLRNAGPSNKAQLSSPTLVARLMGLESLPLSPRGAGWRDARCDYHRKSFKPLDLSSRSVATRGKQSRGGELKKDHVDGEICCEERNAGRKQRRECESPTKGRDLVPRSNLANFEELNVEIVELKKELRERARLAMKHIPVERNEGAVKVDNSSLKKSSNKADIQLKAFRGHQSSANDSVVEIAERVAVRASTGKGSVSRHLESSPKMASRHESGLQNKTCVSERSFSPGNDQCNQSKKRDDADSRPAGAFGTNFSSSSEIKPLAKKRDEHQREFYNFNRLENFIPLSRNCEHNNQKGAAHKVANGNRTVKEGAFEETFFASERRQNTAYETKNGNTANFKLPKQSNTSVYSSENPTKFVFGISNPIFQSNSQSEAPKQVEDDNVPWTKDLNVVSFGSSTCKKNESGLPSSVKDKGDKTLTVEPSYDNSCKPEKSVMELNVGNLPCERVIPLGGDRIGTLLEQKIMELRSLDQDDTDTSEDDAYLGRSSASILEELISALTHRHSISGGNMDGFERDHGMADDPCDSYLQSHSAYCREHEFEMLPEAKSPCASSEFSLEGDSYGPSPVSILEPTFSTDNCVSESIGMNAGSKPDLVFIKDSSIRMQLFNNGVDILDSATLSRRESASERASHILDSISIMYNTSPCEIGAVENKPSYAREVISNAELLFANAVNPCRSKGMVESSVDSLLLDTLEVLINAYQSSLHHLTCPGASERSQIRRLLFDCMVEHLDSKYSRFIRSGYKTWVKMSLFQTSEKLAREVSMDINKWMTSEGKVLDVIMSTELRQLPADCTAFDVEVYELGAEIEHALFWGLLNETALDLL